MKTIIGILAVSLVFSAHAKAEIKCEADFSVLEPGAIVKVQITDETKPKVSGSLNIAGQVLEFKDEKVLDFNVRQNINFLSDADDLDLNPGEQRVALMQTYLADPELKSELKLDLSFDLKDVASVRIYDLGGDAETNMMGGSPLVDFKNAKGELLGRFMQGLILSVCK